MKIAIVEHHEQEDSCFRKSRNSEWMWNIAHHYQYSFHHIGSNISDDQWDKINTFINTLHHIERETIEADYPSIQPEHYRYDIDRSKELAKIIGCDIITPNEYTFDTSENSNYHNNSKEFIRELAIKYQLITRKDQHWTCQYLGHRFEVDDNNNIRKENFAISPSLADCIITFYNNHEDENLFNCMRRPNTFYAIIIKGKQYGVINEKGDIIVQYQENKIIEVYDTFCIIETNGSLSCIDFSGHILMPFTNQPFTIYENRYAEIGLDNFKIIYDLHNSQAILNAQYSKLFAITENCILVWDRNNQIDVYNHKSLKINREPFREITEYRNGFIIGKHATGWIVINYHGNILLEDNNNRYDSVESIDGHIQLSQRKPNGYLIYGLADLYGNILFTCFADKPIRVFNTIDGYGYVARKYKKEAIYNRVGERTSLEYDFINIGTEGICIAFNGEYTIKNNRYLTKGGTFYALTLDKTPSFSMDCQYLFNFVGDVATFKKEGKFGKVDKKGNVVIPAIYDAISIFNHGLAAACLNKKWGYIDINNNIIIGFIYDKADDFNEDGNAIIHSDGLFTLINTKGEYLYEWESEDEYDDTPYEWDPSYDDDYIRDGLAEAFNDDPNNYWNID